MICKWFLKQIIKIILISLGGKNRLLTRLEDPMEYIAQMERRKIGLG